MRKFVLVLLLLVFSGTANAGSWVRGDVSVIQEYGNYQNGKWEVLITLINQDWTHYSGADKCTERFRIKEGVLGVDSEIKNRMLSILLSAYMGSKPVGLWVDTSSTDGYCNIESVGIGMK